MSAARCCVCSFRSCIFFFGGGSLGLGASGLVCGPPSLWLVVACTCLCYSFLWGCSFFSAAIIEDASAATARSPLSLPDQPAAFNPATQHFTSCMPTFTRSISSSLSLSGLSKDCRPRHACKRQQRPPSPPRPPARAHALLQAKVPTRFSFPRRLDWMGE